MAGIAPPARLLARAYARGQRLALVTLLLLTIGGAAATLVPLAASARTATVARRALDDAAFPDVSIDVAGIAPEQIDPLRSSPLVRDLGFVGFSAVRPVGTDLVPGIDLVGVIPFDERAGRALDRPRLFAGRLPHPERLEEIAINRFLAARLGVGVGDTVPLELFGSQQIGALFESPTPPSPDGARYDGRVVGIAEPVSDLVDADPSGFGVVVQSYALWRAHGIVTDDLTTADHDVGIFRALLRARLVDGEAGSPEFVQHVTLAYGIDDVSTTFSENPADVFDNASQTLRVESLALRLFAVAAGIATLLTIGQAFARQVSATAGAAERAARGLGVRGRDRITGAALLPAIIATCGVAVAVVAAIALSGLFPRGLGARLEPDRGIRVEPASLALGALVLLAVMLAFVLAAAVRVTRPSGPALAPARMRVPLGRPQIGLGIRLATTSGRGTARVPARQAFVGSITAVTGVVAALVFAASLTHLLATPPLYGIDADVDVPLQSDGGDIADRERPRLVADDDITALTSYGEFEMQLDSGDRVSGAAIRHDKGAGGPVARAGRLPRAPDEIAVDPKALSGSAGIGDELSTASGTSLRVVGHLVPGLDFVVTEAAAERLGVETYDLHGFAVSWRDGVDGDAAADRLRERFAEVHDVEPQPDVRNLRLVRSFPFALAGLLAVVGAAAVAHLLVTGTRRRARDLAMLRVLGFRRRTVRATVRWQALTIAAAGASVGTLLGIVAGRGAWALVTDGLGVVYAPTIDVIALAATACAAVVISVLVAILPARAAARIPPSATLRAE